MFIVADLVSLRVNISLWNLQILIHEKLCLIPKALNSCPEFYFNSLGADSLFFIYCVKWNYFFSQQATKQ